MNINIDERLRAAYYAALSGQLFYGGAKIPVADGFSTAEGIQQHHVIISEVNEATRDTMETFITEAEVVLDIITWQYNGYTKSIAANIEGQILAILKPDFLSTLTVPGLQISSLRKTAGSYIEESGDNGNIVRKILRITQLINKI